ncbi:MAG: M48 family metallopeptidase [Saprospiraceae bacterium]|nr:M48 family metallopeptidase [Saprospiraceae bacterium]
MPTLKHKFLNKRWGSCIVTNIRLLLNTELIMASRTGIEYVVAHG